MTHPPIGTTSDGEPVTPRIGNHITLRIIAWLNPGAGAKGMIAIRRTPVAPSIKFTVLLAIITPVFAIFTPALSNVARFRSEENTSELQYRMRITYAVFSLQKNT